MKDLSDLKLVAIDTNIFIYYFEDNPQFGTASKKIIDALSSKSLSGVTSIIAISETLSKKDLPIKIAKDIENDFFEIPKLTILEVDRKVAVKAAKIRREYGFRLPDAIQLATAIISRVQALITNDDRLKKFKELKVILLAQTLPLSQV